MVGKCSQVRIETETYIRFRKLIFLISGDIAKGDILKYATKAIELYISENLPEGVKL